MVLKVCSRSQGQPLPGVRSAAITASRSSMDLRALVVIAAIPKSVFMGSRLIARKPPRRAPAMLHVTDTIQHR